MQDTITKGPDSYTSSCRDRWSPQKNISDLERLNESETELKYFIKNCTDNVLVSLPDSLPGF